MIQTIPCLRSIDLMDRNIITRSLPPLVEGKLHGSLKLVISEVIWHRTRPGDVTVIASWWGETDSVRLRPVDPTMDSNRSPIETCETYAVRTSFDLLQEYLANCGTVDLLIMSETSNEVVGTAQISDLMEIFQGKYTQYCSIYNKVGTKIGDIPVSLTLSKGPKPQKSSRKLAERQVLSIPANNLLEADPKFSVKEHFAMDPQFAKPRDDIYRSILKDKRFNINGTWQKPHSNVTDKLVAQVVARAKKLRGILSKDTRDDLIEIDDKGGDSWSGAQENEPEDQLALYKYLMGTDMTRKDEKRALQKLRCVSPTSSLIEFATESISSRRDPAKTDTQLPEERTVSESSRPSKTPQQTERSIMDCVDSLKISIELLTLTSAGYRRVKSSCLTRSDGLPLVNYFVQYDAAFANVKKYNKKVINENERPIKITSRKQDGQMIYFNHEAMYNLARSKRQLPLSMPLNFKVFIRHLDQRSPIELGAGSMCLGDAAQSPHLTSTQRVALVKKGIKVGELLVTIELGCDRIHFGRQLVEAVTMAKENIPVLDISNSGSMRSSRYTCGTGSESKSSGTSATSSSLIDKKTNTSRPENKQKPMSTSKSSKWSDERVKVEIAKVSDDQPLLHGLIYISQGKNLSEMNTYIVCRALWRQDMSSSRVCSDTTDPYYDFHQIIPLIYGPELLERTRDNCIIIEVYSKRSVADDSLIGIAKLSVHEMYMVLRDPLVLPNLVKSRKPVITVDGWIPISDPVTGTLCGELSALVALGTADQIALLEMTKGVCRGLSNSAHLMGNSADRPSSLRTQQCQTEISTIADVESTTIVDSDHGDTIVNAPQVSTAPRAIVHQEAQTEFPLSRQDSDPLRVDDTPGVQTPSVNPSDGFSGDYFTEARTIYRSVGVGAEFNEPSSSNQNNQSVNIDDYASSSAQGDGQPSESYPSKSDVSPLLKDLLQESNENTDDDDEEEGFRAIIEIECALHLPPIKLPSGQVEPSTYVTFQKSPGGQQETSAVVAYSCNPHYSWRCDTKLSTQYLTNDKIRLIMKVRRLVDDQASNKINAEKDVVIGFSAIDLFVLTAGFPVVSGWFHINDFSGKSQGQLKVSVTPVDDITAYHKSPRSNPSIQQPVNTSNLSFPYAEDLEEMGGFKRTETSAESQPPEVAFDITLGLGDASMSVLSSSLKQKLTELDEIKQRLQSRLLDVTNTAFDDLDNDFEFIEGEMNSEEDDHNRNNHTNSTPGVDALFFGGESSNENRKNVMDNQITNGNGEMTEREDPSTQLVGDTNASHSLEGNLPDTGYFSGSNLPQETNGHRRGRDREPRTFTIPDQSTDPARGTRMHISHLLDKLSMQLTTVPAPIATLPMKRNIMDLISSLRRNNNNFSDIKCNRQASVRTVPTQTDLNFISNNSEMKTETKRNNSSFSTDEAFKDDEIPAKAQKREKVSTIIRQELMSDDLNDSEEFDELSTHLITSNIRHMGGELMNPLLYRHAPDVGDLPDASDGLGTSHKSTSPPSSIPEEDNLDILDSRYSESFTATMNRNLGRLRNLLEGQSLSNVEKSTNSSTEGSCLSPVEPGNADGNIHVTVIHKACDEELMASNSIGSTTISMDIQTPTDVDDASSLNSESEASTVSRQAPDGANTVEDPATPLLPKEKEEQQN